MASIGLLMQIGWRNLWRNPRRTLLTALALGLGLALLLVALGILDGDRERRIARGVRLGTGHVVVQAKGYQDTQAQELLLPAWVTTAIKESLQGEAMRHTLPEVSPRLITSGLLSSAANSAGIVVFGVVPEEEQAVFLIPQHIVEGFYLKNDDLTGVVIGAELARKLEVKIGSKVVLMVQRVGQSTLDAGDGAGGEIQSTLLRVTGIFRTGLREIDAQIIHLPLPAVQALLATPDQVSQVTIFLAQERNSPMVAEHLRERLAEVPAEVLTWRESMAEMAQIFRLENTFNSMVGSILLVMVGLGLLNTTLMAVLERRYEFGVCAALGLRPGQLAGMVLCESLALTIISLIPGLALGMGLHLYFATRGLDLHWVFGTDLPGVMTVVTPIIYSRLNWERIVWSVSFVFAMAVAMSLYPALKAARTALPGALKVF